MQASEPRAIRRFSTREEAEAAVKGIINAEVIRIFKLLTDEEWYEVYKQNTVYLRNNGEWLEV